MKSLAVCLLVLAAECIMGGMGRLAFHFGAKRQTNCAETELQQCIQPIQDLENPFSGSKLEDLSDPEVLDRTCTLLDQAKSCVSSYVRDCYPAAGSDLSIQTFESVVGYICSAEGRDVILTESKCLNNPEFERSMQHCADQMQMQMQQVFVDPDADMSSICGVMDGLSECVGDKVKEQCSQKAVNFVKGLVSRLTTPLRSMVGCDIQVRMARDLFNLINAARRK